MTAHRHDAIFKPGDLLNNTYRIEAILGRGGTSEVYRARSEISGRVVALKVLRSEYARNEDYLSLMRREEEIRDVRHDAIVRYFDNQRMADGTVYLVMDYVDGPALDALMRAGGMSAGDLLVVMERVASGLAAAHHHNIVHRDLSPDNIILRAGRPEEAVIIDFGIAKDLNPGAMTIVGGEFAGKYAYAAPEQLAGEADERTDLYTLGALALATFRGQPPDPGDNLMEVVRRKGLPLDTGGVPEPLRGLIDRLTVPDRSQRFQSADELLDALMDIHAPLGDATVVVPRGAGEGERPKTVPPSRASGPSTVRSSGGRPSTVAPRASAPPPPAKPGSEPSKAVPPEKRRGGLLVPGLIALVVIAGAGGTYAYLTGLFGPQVPVADPFVLIAEKADGGAPIIAGNVPSPEIRERLTQLAAARGGSAELIHARGAIAEGWGDEIVDLLDVVSILPEWRVEVTGNDAAISGLADNDAERDRLVAALDQDRGSLDRTVSIDVGPRLLKAETVASVLGRLSDCGPLSAKAPGAEGWALGETVAVSGTVARGATRTSIEQALGTIAGDRTIDLQVDVRSPAACSLDAVLPAAPSGGFRFLFGYGDRGDPNPQARYLVGENPTIDLVIPADVAEGYLYVDAFDVSGNVFHLLPNLNRTDNAVKTLRGGTDGPVEVRMAFGLEEAKAGNKLAFLVDETVTGETRMVVIHSDRPLFDELRPTTESTEGYAKALAEIAIPIRALDQAVLTTAKP